MSESLLLKWGTLKAWHLETDKSKAVIRRYFDAGPVSGGAMTQRDTPEQKQAICDLIDAIDAGEIGNDWSGETMTKDAAKKYVMEYGQDRSREGLDAGLPEPRRGDTPIIPKGTPHDR